MLSLPHPVVLASGSPRRRELLARLVPEFEVLAVDADETPLSGEAARGTAGRLAGVKAHLASDLRPGCLVIGGDTVVACPGPPEVQFAKPESPSEAFAMLRALSGGRHEVLTGVAVLGPGFELTFVETTEVWFRPLTDDEIEAYIATGEPMDKAGAYAIQGGAEGFVDRIDGPLTNVVGLPLEALERTLLDVPGVRVRT